MIAAAAAAYKTSDPANAPPTQKEMEGIWQNIFLGPGTPFSEADINAFTTIESVPRARACELTITFMKRILALPPADCVAALRARCWWRSASDGPLPAGDGPRSRYGRFQFFFM